jgi:hypothetical protein
MDPAWETSGPAVSPSLSPAASAAPSRGSHSSPSLSEPGLRRRRCEGGSGSFLRWRVCARAWAQRDSQARRSGAASAGSVLLPECCFRRGAWVAAAAHACLVRCAQGTGQCRGRCFPIGPASLVRHSSAAQRTAPLKPPSSRLPGEHGQTVALQPQAQGFIGLQDTQAAIPATASAAACGVGGLFRPEWPIGPALCLPRRPQLPALLVQAG